MHIIINRDAVCAADDMSHHCEVYLNILSLNTFLSSLEITWFGRSITTTLRWALILPKIVVL